MAGDGIVTRVAKALRSPDPTDNLPAFERVYVRATNARMAALEAQVAAMAERLNNVDDTLVRALADAKDDAVDAARAAIATHTARLDAIEAGVAADGRSVPPALIG